MHPTPTAARSSARATAAAFVLALMALAGVLVLGNEWNITGTLSAWAPHLMPSTTQTAADDGSPGAGAHAGAVAPVSPPALVASRAPRLYLVLPAFQGDRQLFFRCFNASLEAFLDWRGVHLTVLLDGGSPSDRAFAAQLQQGFGARVTDGSVAVQLLDPPSPGVVALQPHLSRTMYAQFLADTHLPADARRDDVIGLMDMESPLMALLPPLPTLLHATDGGPGTIRMQAAPGDALFPMDSVLLGEPSTFSLVGGETSPQFFFVGTLAAARDHVTRTAGAVAFDDALATAFNKAPATERALSAPNVIFSYAVAHEPERYGVAVRGAPGALAAPSFGFLGMCRANADFTMRRGCCRAFGMGGCMSSELVEPCHVTVALEGASPHFPTEELRRVADEVYAAAARQVARMPADVRARMEGACTEGTGLKPATAA